jgi:hypothetical protein
MSAVSASEADAEARAETEALKAEVIECLGRLRPLLRETAEKYFARLEAQIAQLSEAVKAQETAEAPGRVRRGLGKIRDAGTDLGVKPEKARRKDLKKIEEFVDKAWETTQGW